MLHQSQSTHFKMTLSYWQSDRGIANTDNWEMLNITPDNHPGLNSEQVGNIFKQLLKNSVQTQS